MKISFQQLKLQTIEYEKGKIQIEKERQQNLGLSMKCSNLAKTPK